MCCNNSEMQKLPMWLPIDLGNSVEPPFFCWRKFSSWLLWAQSNYPILKQPAVIWFSFHMYILITQHQCPSSSEILAYIRISVRYSESTDRCFVVISSKDFQLCLVHCTNLKLTFKVTTYIKAVFLHLFRDLFSLATLSLGLVWETRLMLLQYYGCLYLQ